MKLFTFLLRHSRCAVFVAVLAGVVSGAANTAMLALFNSLLTGAEGPTSRRSVRSSRSV